MAKIWNKRKQFHPVRKSAVSNGANTPLKRKVFVGMSGGVDSSVSAALLKEGGFDVTGVFIKVWQPDWMECTWREDRLDAMRVCVELGIPFKTLDLEEQYKKDVVDYMVSQYKAGRTPNPDIMCNASVKFGAFFDFAMEQGADYIATGHYARIEQEGGVYKLLTGIDEGKDQSYFLWTLAESQLSKILFPVGGMEKTGTRRLARKFNLPVAEKKDSQGLCFIGKVDAKEFLSHYIEPKKGKVLDRKGNIIGEHDGAVFYTPGQKLSFEPTEKSSREEPFYVISRDAEKNNLKVSHKSPQGRLPTEKTNYRLERINWISKTPEENKTYQARVRHLGDLAPCIFKGNTVIFRVPTIVASGQSVVLYDGEQCLGGGIVI